MTTHVAKQDRAPSVAFLIDADNLPAVEIDDAFEHLKQAGAAVLIRRAYGGIEKLAGMKDVLRRHSVQAFVNQGKGTTDVALVVDAMDLLHRGALPSTVAIGSSDADFAPLAVRLREAGMLVICFAQKLISSEALPLAYDKVVFLDARSNGNQPRVSEQEGQESSSTLPLRSAVVVQPVVSCPEKPVVDASRASSSAVRVSAVSVAEDLDMVRRILVGFPSWLPNTIMQLNQLGAPLHESGIKKGSKPLHELFRKYPSFFKVLPLTGPAKQVRLLKRP